MPRLRKRAVGLLIGAGVLFFLATNVQAGWLFVLSALMIGVVLAGWIMPAVATRGVRVARDGSDRVHQGDDTAVDVCITNAARGTRRGLVVHDAHLDPVDLWVGTVRPGERVEVTTIRRAMRRGLHESSPLQVRSRAPFGVSERRRTLPAGGSTLVLPKVEPLGPLPFIEPAPSTEHAIHSAPRRGHGPEYLGIREYRPGDSMRHVHWPSTARTGAVMVREFEQEQTRRLAIVVDPSRDAGSNWTVLDRVCCAAASVASAALAQGHGARLVVPGSDGNDEGPEVLVRADEEEILERLALVTPPDDSTDPGFAATVGGLAEDPCLRGVETVVLVFPTWRANDAVTLPPQVERLVERIQRVVAVPVVVGAHETKRHGLDEEARAALQQRLRAAGAAVYPWHGDEDLALALGGRTS